LVEVVVVAVAVAVGGWVVVVVKEVVEVVVAVEGWQRFLLTCAAAPKPDLLTTE
jgi:hypothetical protein